MLTAQRPEVKRCEVWGGPGRTYYPPFRTWIELFSPLNRNSCFLSFLFPYWRHSSPALIQYGPSKRQQFPNLLKLNSTRSLHRKKIFSPEAYSWSTWPTAQPARGSLRLLCSPSNMHQTTNYHWSGPPAPCPGPPRPPLTLGVHGTSPNVHFCGRVRARRSRASASKPPWWILNGWIYGAAVVPPLTCGAPLPRHFPFSPNLCSFQ